MLDRVTGMQVFARVAALGSLSAAGRALGMSQTMATKHLAALESRLGTRLLHRTTRRLTLTEAGRRYLESVERILAELEEADAAASIETVEVRGTLRLNAPFSFGIREIAPLLPEFSRRHPDLTVDLGLNDRVVDLIEEGWDMVVRIGRMQSSTMVARRLAPSRVIVCAAPSYLERRGTPATIADLGRHDCLGYTLSQRVGAGRWAFGRDGRHVVEVKGSLKANNGDALVVAAVGGQGIVYMPSFLVGREIRAGLLVPLTLDEEPFVMDGVFAAYPADRRPPAKVRACIDHLARQFAPVPPWEREPANADAVAGQGPDHDRRVATRDP
ncbi:LysR family transcriptional regulator [Rhodoplanes roseus]|uniref:LysR family transcriptional regulator n=1 Tax=Rhodoplanes roseus TaxID=29409 RepID=A0A327KZG9_9BRAD|nr:LysR family transcriptional regulator [Rhodoplanes roseus]RAI43631.1 LysR family transcriptional regulator [Rhodoplanes roseus]